MTERLEYSTHEEYGLESPNRLNTTTESIQKRVREAKKSLNKIMQYSQMARLEQISTHRERKLV